MTYWPGVDEPQAVKVGEIAVRPPSALLDGGAAVLALYLASKGRWVEAGGAGIAWYELYKKRLIAEGIFSVVTKAKEGLGL